MSGESEIAERATTAAGDRITVRECESIEEFDGCVELQREAFGLPDLELSPRRHLIVARSAGGFVLGAFDGARLVGFVLNQVAARGREIIGYSHMMAVAHAYQNRGIGARLKWAQRERSLAQGSRFIKWTWDPMQARNAHFNINRLGVGVKTYAANFYGTDYAVPAGESGKQHGIDSDRLVAAWELDSPKVAALARGEAPASHGEPEAFVSVPPRWGALLRDDPEAARREQLRVREEFQRAFAAGLVCAGFERDLEAPRYLFYRENG
jgi:predicted GNAT superfamily acetyltransferase